MTIRLIKLAKVQAGSYVADSDDLHIEIDKCAADYLNWQVFITRTVTPATVSPDAGTVFGDRQVVYHTFADTFAEAKDLTAAFAEADAILQRAV